MSYQNINQYNFNKIGFRPVNEIIDVTLASDELNYDIETVLSTKLIAEDDGNRMPFNFDFDYSGTSNCYNCEDFNTDVLVSKNYYNPLNDNLLINQKKYTIFDVGLTGIDNGLTQSITGETIEINTGLYTAQSDIFNKSKFDRKLKLFPITGFTTNANRLYNDNSYSYPITKEITLTTGIYSRLDGGFYQGFYRLFGYDYEIFPERVDLGWSVELLVRYRWTGDTLVGLNARYPENKGTFFYLGTRAENKFYSFTEDNPPIISISVTPTRTPIVTPTIPPSITPSITPTITPTPSVRAYYAYIFAEPQSFNDGVNLENYMLNESLATWGGFQFYGVPSEGNYSNNMNAYAHYSGWTSNTGNYTYTPTSLSGVIKQINNYSEDSFGCPQNQYTFETIRVRSNQLNTDIKYFYSIWIPIDGVGNTMANMTINAGSGPCGTDYSEQGIPDAIASQNVTITSGAAIPTGTYRVLFLSLLNLPNTNKLLNDIYIKGNLKI